jgi:hypothetical protein
VRITGTQYSSATAVSCSYARMASAAEPTAASIVARSAAGTPPPDLPSTETNGSGRGRDAARRIVMSFQNDNSDANTNARTSRRGKTCARAVRGGEQGPGRRTATIPLPADAACWPSMHSSDSRWGDAHSHKVERTTAVSLVPVNIRIGGKKPSSLVAQPSQIIGDGRAIDLAASHMSWTEPEQQRGNR